MKARWWWFSFPMLEQLSTTLSFNVQNQLTKPKNRLSNLEIKALIRRKRIKLQDFKPQARAFSLFKLQWRWNLNGEKVVRDGSKYGAKWT